MEPRAEVHEHRGPGTLQVPDVPSNSITRLLELIDAQRGAREEEVPQGKRGDKVGARRGKVGPREGGHDSRVRVTAIFRAAGGVE